MKQSSSKTKGLFIWACLTAFMTWCLIMVGGIVHGTGSSLACPDWPTCHGSFFPEMIGGVFYEHSHRLVASLVGLLTIGVMVLCLRQGNRRLKVLGILALALVIFQGVLGGITVLYRLPPAISISHLGTSMIYFALVIWIAFESYPFTLAKSSPVEVSGELRAARPWILGALAMVYLQIVLGALVRHSGSGLACTEIPLCQGSLWPAEAAMQVKIHMLHRIFAMVAGLAVFAAAMKVFSNAREHSILKCLALSSSALVLLQITLGFLSVASALELIPVTAHLSIGALLWANLVLMNFIHGRVCFGPRKIGIRDDLQTPQSSKV